MQDNSATAMGMSGAFYSTYTHTLDKKGRVSVPSAFRRVLKTAKQTEVFCCPAANGLAIDAGGPAFQAALRDALLVPHLSWADRDYLETVLFGQSGLLKIDSDGRIALPEMLISVADLSTDVIFVGKGNRFQLWAPDRFAEHLKSAQRRAAEIWSGPVPGSARMDT